MKGKFLLISVLWVLLVSCSRSFFDQYTEYRPESIDDGLNVGSPDEVNIEPGIIGQAVNDIRRGKYKEVHSLLIFRNGKLVCESYFQGHRFQMDGPAHHGERVQWNRSMPHRIMSVTKSITSACVGIAVDHGFIENVQQSIFDYLPEYTDLNTGGKAKITIEHLLTMTSGLQGNEWLVPYSHPKNDVIQVYLSGDPVPFILHKPLKYEPGEFFQYYGGSNFLLGEIIRHAAKMDLDAFSGIYLFDPLGIHDFTWLQLNKGVVDGAGGLLITPRDMMKIGVTFLNGGTWNGRPVVSKQWVEESAASFPGNRWMNNWDDHWGLRGYAFSWWTHDFVHKGQKIHLFYAAGWGGQYIMVMPDLNMVVTFTGGNYTTTRPPFEILKKYILPALN